jgi:stage V sporulation protein R
MAKLLYDTNDWTFEKLKLADESIAEIAFKELKLDIYPNQIEIIGSDQMLDAYSSVGLPLMYNHWSFGKKFIREQNSYKKGLSGLAYEIVINSSPCISYLMEENSMTMQTLVIAHAAYGHNHFFKNNYLFRQWTEAESILDYLQFAKNYITKCEERYGEQEVEHILDACHAIQYHGVDRYKRPRKLNKNEEQEQQKAREIYVQQQANELWQTLPLIKRKSKLKDAKKFPAEPQENLLYFIEKYSPKLESWQREIIRIVRKINQYFYPQMQTKVMNEGWASFVHYYCMNRLWEKELISDGHYLEFIHSHSGVLRQLPYDHKYYNGFNPYALGFDMFSDIKRICEKPTNEDREYFPHLIGQNWLDVCLDAVKNYRDESFISQFLSPTIMRKWRLFEITDLQDDRFVTVSSIQNMENYNNIRQTLSRQYSINRYFPDIQIVNANLQTTRELELVYKSYNQQQLTTETSLVLEQMKNLWGYHVSLSINNEE